MKIKTFFGVIMALAFSTILSCAVFADPYFKIDEPIDLSTGTTLEEYKTGSIIAYPVYLYTDSSSDSVKNYMLSLVYDSTVLYPYGLDEDDNTIDEDILDNFYDLGGYAANNLHDSSDNKTYAINHFVNSTGKKVYGTASFTKTDSTCVCGMVVSSINSAISNNLIAYFLFEVVGDLDDDTLNSEVIKLNPAASYGGSSITLVAEVENETALDGTITKANACVGAMNVVVDTAELTGVDGWIQEVDVSIDGGTTLKALELCSNSDTKYTFPVRIVEGNTTLDEKTIVSVYVQTSKAETAASGETLTLTKVAEVEISTDGTVESYSDYTATAANPTTADE